MHPLEVFRHASSLDLVDRAHVEPSRLHREDERIRLLLLRLALRPLPIDRRRIPAHLELRVRIERRQVPQLRLGLVGCV
eukprot:767108-Hanusia_phi.AAC.11